MFFTIWFFPDTSSYACAGAFPRFLNLNKMNIYELTQETLALIDVLEENGGELTPEIEQMLKINESETTIKFEAYAKAIAYETAKIEVAKVEIERLQDAKKRAENAVDRMKDALLWSMEATDKKKIEAGTYVISTRKSKAVIIDDESKITSKYVKEKITYSVDKIAIKEAIAEGVDVPGAHIEERKSINIR